jgi:alpha-amylase
MKTICLYFQVHQPMRLRRYRFFDIGNNSYYYDDYLNESIMHKVASRCYLPVNKILLSLIKEYGVQFKVTFSITGIALDQFQLYAPEVLDSFRELAKTGSVEFLAETYSHSLASLKDDNEFKKQVETHKNKITEFFGVEPKAFRNAELVYSDTIGAKVADMGFKVMLTEGPKHILGWKSPNYLYCNAINPKLKVLLKNFKLSDDIAFRFSNKGWSEYPLTADKYVKWLSKLDSKEETINLFMDYETFGEHQGSETGILQFLKSFPTQVFKKTKMIFSTPSEIADRLQPVAAVHVPHPISWADEERDLTAWLGNEMQEDAFNRLYSLVDKINKCHDNKILTDWKYLQSSDHFYYMCTKVFSDGDIHQYFNPFSSPYDAYINYMNILSDFIIRLNTVVPESDQEKEVATLAAIIYEKDLQIEKYENELADLKFSHLKSSSRPNSKASSKVKEKKSSLKTTPKTMSKTVTKIAAKPVAKRVVKVTPKKETLKKPEKKIVSSKKNLAHKSTPPKSTKKIKPTK